MSGKKLAIIGVVMVLVLGGGAFGVYSWKMNSVAFQGISLPMQGVPDEARDKWVEMFEKISEEETVLKVIVEQSNYQKTMGVDGEEAAIADLKSRIKIKFRPRKNTIEIGLNGKRKEVEELKLIAPTIYAVTASVLAKNDPLFQEFAARKKSQ